MAVETFTKAGAKATTPAKLSPKVFGLRVENHQLLKEAYVAYLANGRANLAKTKKRGEVRGGGAKPWRQKGTGRARTGSIRSPIWSGGGVTFGPTGEENFSRRMSIKSKRLALRQALSLASKNEQIKVIDSISFADGKVKSASQLLDKIKVRGRTLLIVDKKDDNIDRATRNIQNVNAISATYLSVFDVLNADFIVVTKTALTKLEEWLGGSNG